MKNLKKTGKRFFALFLSLVLALGIVQTSAIAASWNPGDEITINVRVFDVSTGKTYDVGTDSVEKGDQYIQSVNYQIPQLTKFVKADQFGRVQKVVGNWYFPSGDSQPGANVEWSCNVSKVTMTYWVNWFSTGSGTGGNTSDTIDLGGSGRNTINFTIRYHSNYPSGTNYTATKKYTVKNYATIYNVFSSQFLTYTDCGFGGFTPKATEKTWYTTSACTTVAGTIGATNGGTYDLYAGWEPGPTPVETLTLTYMNGNTVYRSLTGYSAGDDVLVLDCTATKDGYTFEGWDTSSSATTVVYKAGQTFQIMGNTVLYAVWKENTPVPTTTTLKLLKGIDGITQDQLPNDFELTAIVRNVSTKEQKTYTIDKNTEGLNQEIVISLSDTYTVTMSESNYDVTGYTCEVSGGEDAMDMGGIYIYTITPGTVEPLCVINNTYTSDVPAEPTKPEITKTVQRWDNGWVDVEVDPDTNETEEIDPGTRLKYTVRVVNPGSVAYENLRVSDVMSFELALDQDSCQGVLKLTDGSVINLDKPTINVIPNRSTTQTWNIAKAIPADAVVEITYEAVVGEYQITSMDNRASAVINVLQPTMYVANDIANDDITSTATVKVITKAPAENVTNLSNATTVEDTADADSGLGV